MARNKFDNIVDLAVARILKIIDETQEEGTPFNSKKLTKREQLLNYLPTRSDPVAARQIVDREGIKGAIEYVETMERYLKEVLTDAGYTE